jgi:coenzyme PQQ biosynthesis protein PqqD
LAAKARLRRDRRDGRFLLLSPERGLILNDTAQEVLCLCTGHVSVATIIETLRSRHPDVSGESIARDVMAFVWDLQSRGLVEAA